MSFFTSQRAMKHNNNNNMMMPHNEASKDSRMNINAGANTKGMRQQQLQQQHYNNNNESSLSLPTTTLTTATSTSSTITTGTITNTEIPTTPPPMTNNEISTTTRTTTTTLASSSNSNNEIEMLKQAHENEILQLKQNQEHLAREVRTLQALKVDFEELVHLVQQQKRENLQNNHQSHRLIIREETAGPPEGFLLGHHHGTSMRRRNGHGIGEEVQRDRLRRMRRQSTCGGVGAAVTMIQGKDGRRYSVIDTNNLANNNALEDPVFEGTEYDENNNNDNEYDDENGILESGGTDKDITEVDLDALFAGEEQSETYFLPSDIYSYLAVADYITIHGLPTTAFLVAFFVLAFQIVTLGIFISNEVNLSNRSNPISVPSGVPIEVRISQFIALLISTWNQDEIRASFNVFALGYNKPLVRIINRNARSWKWYLSIFMRIILGCSSLSVTFILVMNSETVRDVMLDFAAVTFVSELDNGAFLFACWGYMGKSLKKFTLKLKRTPVYEKTHFQSQAKGLARRVFRVPRMLYLSIMFMIIFGFWVWIAIVQDRGDFMSQNIYVQFTDDFVPAIGAYSGVYKKILDDSWSGMRVNYVDLKSGTARFSYCVEDNRWRFTFRNNSNEISNICQLLQPNAISAKTDGFDILETSSVQWQVREEELRLDLPLQRFWVADQFAYNGKPCSSHADCSERMFCGEDNHVHDNEEEEEEEGSTGQKICQCYNGNIGVSCEFPAPCRVVEINPLDPQGFSGSRSWSRRYEAVVMEEATNSFFMAYDKPIYIGDEHVGVYDFMIFTGRRWILTDSGSIDHNNSGTFRSRRELAEFLSHDFHAFLTNFTFYFASEPVDKGTPTELATPVGFSWFRPETSEMRGVSLHDQFFRIWSTRIAISAELNCAVCDEFLHPCFYGGVCDYSTGSCDCSNSGGGGRLCQVPPVGNGFCDVYFNTPEFDFDGGDCCRETCISTEEHICGMGNIPNQANLEALGYVGYPNCQDPRFVSTQSESKTLDQIMARGVLRCGSRAYPGFVERHENGTLTGFEVDLCKAIAAAVLNDPEAIEIIDTTWADRWIDLAASNFDVLIFRSTYSAERDVHQVAAQTGFSFARSNFYDGMMYGGIPQFADCADNLDFESAECTDLKICVAARTTWFGVTEKIFPISMLYQVADIPAQIAGLESGLCNVIAGPIFIVAEFAARYYGFTGPEYKVGVNIRSKEPQAAATRQDDPVWSKFVSWVFEALYQAEENGITQASANKIAATHVFGDRFQYMFRNAVAANGHFGEIYSKNLEDKIPRSSINQINKYGETGGLLYSMPLGAIETRGPDPIGGGAIETIQKRGKLNCGVRISPGFAVRNGEDWSGFFVDICRGIAAALFNGNPNVEIIETTGGKRFQTLAAGTIDILVDGTTKTLAREVGEATTGLGLDFTPTIFFDGLQFGGIPPYAACADSLSFDNKTVNFECPNTKICVRESSTWYEAMAGPLGIPQQNMLLTNGEEMYEQFMLGNCNVLAGETVHVMMKTLAARGYSDDRYKVGSKMHTKEPLAIVSRPDDVQFTDFLRWVVFGFFYAAEEGITRNEYISMPVNNFLFGTALSGMWRNAVAAVGNYEEIFSRNLGHLLQVNVLNTINRKDGPQMFAYPGIPIEH